MFEPRPEAHVTVENKQNLFNLETDVTVDNKHNPINLTSLSAGHGGINIIGSMADQTGVNSQTLLKGVCCGGKTPSGQMLKKFENKCESGGTRSRDPIKTRGASVAGLPGEPITTSGSGDVTCSKGPIKTVETTRSQGQPKVKSLQGQQSSLQGQQRSRQVQGFKCRNMNRINCHGYRGIPKGNSLLGMGNPLLKLGNPLLKLGNPLLKLGNSLLRLGNSLLRLGNPLLKLGNPLQSGPKGSYIFGGVGGCYLLPLLLLLTACRPPPTLAAPHSYQDNGYQGNNNNNNGNQGSNYHSNGYQDDGYQANNYHSNGYVGDSYQDGNHGNSMDTGAVETGAQVERSSSEHYKHSQVVGVDYLMSFGYLPQSDRETGALRTEEEMHKSIRKFQQFAQLPLTGELDPRTLEMMTRRRCGLPDLPPRRLGDYDVTGRKRRHHAGRHRGRRYVLSPDLAQWRHRNLTYRILNYSPDLPMASIQHTLRRAFRVWSDVTLLTFREVMQGDADVMIKFAHGYHSDGYPFDGPGQILAHAFYPGDGRGGDVHFDEEEDWTEGTLEGTNLFSVATHEIGHSLGLGHSSVPGSLMYPWYQGFTHTLQLHTDDIAGIQYLYGRPDTPWTARPVAPTSPPWPRPSAPGARPTSPGRYPTDRPRSDGGSPGVDEPLSPHTCYTDLDAIAVIRGEVFAFKGNWFWRRDEKGVMVGYPVQMNRFWYGLPSTVDSIDAIYERQGDGKIVFFKGKKYWLFTGNHLVPNFPTEGRPLTELGFPHDIEKVDAAFIWGHNKKTYFITGDMYWRYNEFTGHMDFDYPRDMKMWEGVPLPVDAAFRFWDGRTYFFRGPYYWVFNDARMSVRTNTPGRLGNTFLDCEVDLPTPTENYEHHVVASAGTTPHRPLVGAITLTSALVLLMTSSQRGL